MECNKDEACRAKEIAERKFREKDFHGAKKFALKAQKLYPDLDGLSQMVMTLDVYISADNRIGKGAADWYGVLGVSPLADDDTIRKQYKKLVLLLHPDKNKSFGADGAFKLVSEAWSFLSDKSKRSAYNRELNVPDSQQRSSYNSSSVNSRSSKANGTHSTNLGSQHSYVSANSSPILAKTFWTMCLKCQTYYEYMRIYLNHNLQCPNCHEAFLAIEKEPPPNAPKTANSSSRPKHQNTKHFGFCNKFPGMSASTPSYPSQHSVKREHEGIWSSSIERTNKKKKVDEFSKNSSVSKMHSQMNAGNGLADTRSFCSVGLKPKSHRELTHQEIRDMLEAKARKQIIKLVREWSQSAQKEAQKRKTSRAKDDCRQEETEMRNETDQRYVDLLSPEEGADPASISSTVITVPDSDFHNFDSDRTESSFADDQVWAAYDENDGMPRYYAKIYKVISLKPFRLKFSWLNSKTNSEFSPQEWVSLGFLKTCGEFRPGKHEITETLNSFSHKVKWTKGMRGIVSILPEKGDIWALYRNWSADWNESTPDDEIHQYDVVQVLCDYNEGITVHPLVKVPGFKTVYEKQRDSLSEMWIPKEEMFRFSHQVPYHAITGEESDAAPKGCWELDPAAIPLELLNLAGGKPVVETAS